VPRTAYATPCARTAFADCLEHPPLQNANGGLYPDIPTTIRRTYATQGLRGFYAGLGTNAIRILPGTCAFFVAYENLSWWIRSTADSRAAAAGDD
jgi:solute carrier family 25 folate transporter 32